MNFVWIQREDAQKLDTVGQNVINISTTFQVDADRGLDKQINYFNKLHWVVFHAF